MGQQVINLVEKGYAQIRKVTEALQSNFPPLKIKSINEVKSGCAMSGNVAIFVLLVHRTFQTLAVGLSFSTWFWEVT